MADRRPQEAAFVAFDLEIAEILPPGTELRNRHGLGIACAATLDETGSLRVWQGSTATGEPAARMSQGEAQALLVYLEEQQAAGRPIVTWNGAAFDLRVLGEEAGQLAAAGRLAEQHVDLMVAFTCVRGHHLSLQAAAEACGSHKGAGGIASGEEVPLLWSKGEHERVLAYVSQDVRATADVARYMLAHQGFTWTSRTGQLARFKLPAGVRQLADMAVNKALTWPEPDTSWMKNPPRRSDFLAWTRSR